MSIDPTTEFVTQLARHDRALTLYVYGLVSRQADADDVLQQTKLIMWKCFADFETGTNFIAWARKIAFHQILGYRRKAKRDPLPLDDDMLEKLGERLAGMCHDGAARIHEAVSGIVHGMGKVQTVTVKVSAARISPVARMR